MKQKHIFILLISVVFFQSTSIFAQTELEEDSIATVDSLVPQEQYGLRVGIDLSKPIRSLFEDDFQGFMVLGDYRIYEDYYLAAEIGNEKGVINEANVTASAQGSYVKLGANYNAYNNWEGMQNLIFVGIRYGFSTFSTELQEYAIYTTNSYFGPDIRTDSQEFKNLTASWVELQFGLKVEVLKNVYLGANIQLKRRISQTKPNTFDNLYIPGFNRTYDDSNFGTGFGYSISYLIPLYKM